MKCTECQCAPLDCRDFECSVCTKEVCCCVSPKQHSIYKFFKSVRTLYATELAIEILCITAAEMGQNSSFILFGYRTAVGITVGYTFGYGLAAFTTFATILDGTVIHANPDGSSTTKKLDGTVITKSPDGLATAKYPDGTVTNTRPDGSSITDKPDGTIITFNPSDGTTITTKPDGTKTTENKDGSWYITFPKKANGSVSTYYEKGTTITKNPDGTTTTH